MTSQDDLYAGYNFAGHVGYGTAAHRAAIATHGITPLHRLSFAPLAKYKDSSTTTTKQKGDHAETMVAHALETEGYTILDRNWRTRYCEIDIVAMKNEELYVVEVKHRKTHTQGGGIAAITPKKRRQLLFAAELYLARHSLYDKNVHLIAVSTEGTPPDIHDRLEFE